MKYLVPLSLVLIGTGAAFGQSAQTPAARRGELIVRKPVGTVIKADRPRILDKVIARPKLKPRPIPTPTPTEKERKLAACKAANGQWRAEIRGINLSAKGSDVDEIYGRIYASVSSGGVLAPSRRAPGWERDNLWESDKNVNLGKYPVTGFPPLRVVNIYGAERHRAKVRVHYDLRDEDDGRGGSNDEYFTIYGTIGSYKGPNNSVEFPFIIPDCDEQPEFTLGSHYTVMGAPVRQGEKNVVTFRFSILATRKFP